MFTTFVFAHNNKRMNLLLNLRVGSHQTHSFVVLIRYRASYSSSDV